MAFAVARQIPRERPLSKDLIESGHAPVNGIQIYCWLHGRSDGVPLVLLHGGGSTIEVTSTRARRSTRRP
jgi:hypothetical protein